MAKHNPFSIFRRNQRAWMAGLTLFTMFSFIALGSMLQCVGTRNQGNGPHYVGDVAKTSTFGTLSYNDFLEYRAEAMRLQAFLENLMGAAGEYQGSPTADLIYLRLQLAVCANNPELLVDRWLIEQYAKKEKLSADDSAVREYLARLVSLNVSSKSDSGEQTTSVASYPSDLIKRCLRAAGLTESQLTEILKGQIAIDRLVRKIDAGIRLAPIDNPYANPGTIAQLGFGHGSLPKSSEDLLTAYEALNCALKLKVASFNAGDFVGQVADPTEAQAKAFYEQYKNIEFHPDSATPGFTQPTKLAMELARIEITDETLDSISMEDVQKYYDEHKEEFRIPKSSSPAADDAPKAENVGIEGETPSLTATPDEILDSLDIPQMDVPAAEEPVQEAPATEDQAPAQDAPAVEEPAKEEGAMTLRQSTLLASYQQEAEPAAEEPAAEAPAEEPAPEAPAEEAANEAPAEEPAPEAPAEEAANETPAEEPAPEAPAEEAANEAPAEEPAPEAPAEEAANEAPAEEAAPVAQTDPGFMPLELVESVIRQRIAAERAEARMSELRNAMQEDFHASQKANDEYVPTFDLKKYAEDNGMQYVVTTTKENKDATKPGLVTLDDAVVMDVLPTSELSQIFSSAPIKFSPRRVGTYNLEESPTALYNPTKLFYVYRVLESKSQNTPEFDEIKDEVVHAWKMREAAKLAEDAAKAFKEKVEGGADFDAVAKEMHGNVVETEKFSWFTSSGFYASPSEVREAGVAVEQAARDNVEIVAPGWDFYEVASSLEKDGLGVVANQPKDRVFVIKVLEKDEVDPANFEKIAGDYSLTTVQTQINNARIEKFHNDWIKSLREKAGFEWISIPKVESNR